ncbi:MAG: hypothetical protein HUK19_07320 [Fibrobacter sp.]|nr:hypothetical protein [Fibrobacter sp.]
MKEILLLLLIPVAVFAGKFDFSLTTAAADYLERRVEPGEDHFAGVAGPCNGAKAAVYLNGTFKQPTPLGSHWLVKDADFKLTAALELSPLSIRPLVKAEFTPVPFLVFGAGGSIGSGWQFFGFDGMSVYDDDKREYEDLTPFKHYYYDFWASVTFQFDTGALIKGDWSHVVMLASYQWIYKGITGVNDGEIWEWQVIPGEANGWQYYVTAVLGYQMPLFLDMVGFMAEFYGHFDRSDFDRKYKGFDGEFMWIDLSLLLEFELNKTNSLKTLFTVEGDRSFSEYHENSSQQPFLTRTGREWSFFRIALIWDHKF